MEDFLTYLLLQEPNIRWVVFGMLVFSMASAVIGCFAFLQKKSLIGDAVSHSLLPGIALAFLFFQSKSLWVLLGGAVTSGWISILVINYVTKHSKIKPDAIIAVVLTTFFGFGIFMLSYIQQFPNANQAGLDKFLFGSAASITADEVYVFVGLAAVILGTITIFFKEFKLLLFDRNFAQVSGLPVRFLDFLFSTLIILAIAIGVQAVGVVLMSALLITPAATAKYWTNKLSKMLFLAVLFACIASYLGGFVSYFKAGMPTGPWIVVFLSVLAFISIFFAPQKGILSRYLRQRRNQRKILMENVLKKFIYIGQKDETVFAKRNFAELSQFTNMQTNQLKSSLKNLVKHQSLAQSNTTWQLTEKGSQRGYELIKLHRLWELYLTEYMNIASDHVHNDAEAIEHIITPEIEQLLMERLGNPVFDPHGSLIDLKPKSSHG